MNNRDKVYDIFVDFFGEDKVDDNGTYIYVYFPELTVTNEYDRSTKIKDLFVRVNVSENGTIIGGFEIIRATYNTSQLKAGYSHSHIPPRDTHNILNWAIPCLGTGPIRETIAHLSSDFDSTSWELFCFELSKYVVTESIAGTPYIRLESITSNRYSYVKHSVCDAFLKANFDILQEHVDFKQFIKYIVKKRPFDFAFRDNRFYIAASSTNIIVTLSNLFIEWYNKQPNRTTGLSTLLDLAILKYGKIENTNVFYKTPIRANNSISGFFELVGRTVLTFKNNPVTFNIETGSQTEDHSNESLFLSIDIINTIVSELLILANFIYGDSKYKFDKTIKCI